MEKARIAVVDDDPDMQTLLREIFVSEGYEIEVFSTGNAILSALKTGRRWDLVICDLRLPDVDGLEIIDRFHAAGSGIPVILITAHAAVETAAQALRKGAFDYIAKPINPVEMSVLASRAIKLNRLERDYENLQKRLERENRKGTLLGQSRKMKQVFTLIDRVASTVANVLITGESGTGKEGVARAIHGASARAGNAFIAINCTAIPEHLLESELFGHRKGAFTGANENRKGMIEEANGGTLFLDEIGDMPASLQAKLLRVLQERKIKPVGMNEYRDVDVRVIAATHQDLKKSIAEGKFREDLFFRLCVVPIEVPPLRERSEDIPLLAGHFLALACEKNGVAAKHLSKAAVAKLMRLEWPGNVRELENAIERAIVLSDRDVIDENELRTESTPRHESVRDLFTKLPTLEQLEREYLAYVLAETGDHKERAAEILGINRKTLYRKEREFGITAKVKTPV